MGMGAMMLPCVIVDLATQFGVERTLEAARQTNGFSVNDVLMDEDSSPWIRFKPEDFGWRIFLLLSIVSMTIGGGIGGWGQAGQGRRTHT